VRDTKDDCVLSKMLVTSCSSCESPALGDGSRGAGDGALECVHATGRETEAIRIDPLVGSDTPKDTFSEERSP
jgi:hypothetical protein